MMKPDDFRLSGIGFRMYMASLSKKPATVVRLAEGKRMDFSS